MAQSSVPLTDRQVFDLLISEKESTESKSKHFAVLLSKIKTLNPTLIADLFFATTQPKLIGNIQINQIEIQRNLLQEIFRDEKYKTLNYETLLKIVATPNVLDGKQQTELLGYLFSNQTQLTLPENMQLIKLLYQYNPPPQEIQTLFNTVYQKMVTLLSFEAKREASFKSQRVGITLPQLGWASPVDGTHDTRARFFVCDGCNTSDFVGPRFACMVCAGYDLCPTCYSSQVMKKGHLPSHPMRCIQSATQVFKQAPQNPTAYFIDLKFNLQSTHTAPALISLLSDLPHDEGASLYLSVPPFDKAHTHFIGTLSSETPVYSLNYPLPKVGKVEHIRIGVIFKPLNVIQKESEKATQVQPADVAASAPLDNSRVESSFSATSHNEVWLCYGEVQPFKFDSDTTFGELLDRSSKRWNLSSDDFELQDDNYRVFKADQNVLTTMKKVSPIIRLVRKHVPKQTATVWSPVKDDKPVWNPAQVLNFGPAPANPAPAFNWNPPNNNNNPPGNASPFKF
mmetsp:Transcript_3061/g.4172  ORF Transcript_3061/g.4172 Transcript_3061/m.4172 type:complete len:511 (-) Transcript_3061:1341-2873(-)